MRRPSAPSACTVSDSLDSWSTVIFCEVISIEVAISYTFWNAKSFSTRSRRWIFSSRIPHTIMSLSIVSSVSLYSQCSAKFLSADTKSVACSRLSDSGEDAKVKGTRKVSGEKKRKRKGDRACNHFFYEPLPPTFGTLEIISFRLSKCWNVNELESFSNFSRDYFARR